MKSTCSRRWLGVLVALISLPAVAQRESGYDHSVVKQVRIDLRDLGYSCDARSAKVEVAKELGLPLKLFFRIRGLNKENKI